MKNRYTKKQICEAIAFWKKQLDKLNESSEGIAATSLQLDNILDALGIFDACAMWPKATTQFKMPPAAVDAIEQAFSQKRGLVKAIGVCIVLSREQYEDELEMHNNKPYEDYIEHEEFTLIEAFSNSKLMKTLTPARTILVDGITVDFNKCSALVVPYTI